MPEASPAKNVAINLSVSELHKERLAILAQRARISSSDKARRLIEAEWERVIGPWEQDETPSSD